MSVFEILIKCVQLNKIDKELNNNIDRFCSLRDNYLNNYKGQDLTDFISFYEECKLDLYNQYKLMLSICDKYEQEVEDEMDLFNKKS